MYYYNTFVCHLNSKNNILAKFNPNSHYWIGSAKATSLVAQAPDTSGHPDVFVLLKVEDATSKIDPFHEDLLNGYKNAAPERVLGGIEEVRGVFEKVFFV
jgi:hypothetical protein